MEVEQQIYSPKEGGEGGQEGRGGAMPGEKMIIEEFEGLQDLQDFSFGKDNFI